MANGSLTFEEFCKLSKSERLKRYDDLNNADRFRTRMSEGAEEVEMIICCSCEHFKNGLTCKAYPDGIPRELILRREHDTPFPGDNGIRYKAK